LDPPSVYFTQGELCVAPTEYCKRRVAVETRAEIITSAEGDEIVAVYLCQEEYVTVTSFRVRGTLVNLIEFLIPLSTVREDTREAVILGKDTRELVYKAAAEALAEKREDEDI
jgi:hypothetical protein